MKVVAPAPCALPCSPEAVDDFVSRPQARALRALRGLAGDVMVLGAGGKMGLHLAMMVRRGLDALGKRQRVIAVSRFGSVHSMAAFARAGIETIACDLADESQVSALPDCPHIFYMAGAKFGTTGNPGLLRTMNVEVPRRVGERFRASRIVAYSTGCVYSFAPVGSAGSREDSPTEPPGEYAQSCLGREKSLAEVASRHGTRTALVRLNYAVEFRYGVLVDICLKVLRGESIDLSTGHVNVIWQGDAIAYSVAALDFCAAPPFILNVTGPGILSVRELAERFGELLGKPPVFAGAEAPTAWLNDASMCHGLFGPPEVSVDEMMKWVAAWAMAGNETYGKPTGFEKRDGRF